MASASLLSSSSIEQNSMYASHIAALRLASAGTSCHLSAVRGPRFHELAPLLEEVAALIGSLGFVAHKMRQCLLGNLAGKRRLLGRPISERRSEAMHG